MYVDQGKTRGAVGLENEGEFTPGQMAFTLALGEPPPPTSLPDPPLAWLRLPPDARMALMADDPNALLKALGPPPLAASPPPALRPDGRASRNWSWLHAAAAHGSPGCMSLLLSNRLHRQPASAFINHRAGDGRPALLIAAEHAHTGGRDCECIEALLRAGAAAHAVQKTDNATAAHLSCAARCPTCLRRLLQRAPHLIDGARRDGAQPLHCAALAGSAECAAVLLIAPDCT